MYILHITSVTQKNIPSVIVIHCCAWYVFLRIRPYLHFKLRIITILYAGVSNISLLKFIFPNRAKKKEADENAEAN